MNNDQFRRLLLANSNTPKPSSNGASTPSTSRTPGGALGSKLKSSIPMTPRSVAGGAHLDFARQLAEKNKEASGRPAKKMRTAAPKGSKLAEGYVDRARTREEVEEDERAVRLKALEESLKKEEIDQATYDRLRGEIAGGDLSSTHLVKGLDFKLLERVRKGEDVFGGKEGAEGTEDGAADGEKEEDGSDDADDILDELEAGEVKTVEREKVQKKGQFAPVSLNPGQKRSRNQLLAEMKAMRAAAKAKQEESSLGTKFKKIGAKHAPGTRIERDSKGREVMIIIDEDGHERRKVRKLDPKAAEEQKREEAVLMSSTVLGMEVPEFYKKQQEAEQAAQEEEDDKEVNIFDDAGSDYDPLAALEEDDASSSDEEGAAKDDASSTKPPPPASTDMPPPPLPASKTANAPRNYFQDSKTGLTSQEAYKSKTLAVDDPAFLAALKKAKSITAAEKTEEEQKAADREARLRQKLLDSQRDDDDLDLGFGSSRAEDEADLGDEPKIKLSEWRGDGDDDEEEEEGGGGGKGKGKQRKRGGGKKRKGDKNSFADVMKVIERNKADGAHKG